MIDKKIKIANAKAKEIYQVLLDSDQHTELTGDKARITPHEGGAYETFDGYASGITKKLVPNTYIEQTWRASDWPDDQLSTITFALSDVDNGCEIHFTQTGIPKGRVEEYEQGWQDNYWHPLEQWFA